MKITKLFIALVITLSLSCSAKNTSQEEDHEHGMEAADHSHDESSDHTYEEAEDHEQEEFEVEDDSTGSDTSAHDDRTTHEDN